MNWWAHGEDRAIACFSPSCKTISFILSSISFVGNIEHTNMTWLPMCGFIARLVEHRGFDFNGFEPVEALNFFRLIFPNCINWWAHGEDRAIPYSNINPQKPRFVTDLSRKRHVCRGHNRLGFDQICLSRMFDHRGFYQHHINFL